MTFPGLIGALACLQLLACANRATEEKQDAEVRTGLWLQLSCPIAMSFNVRRTCSLRLHNASPIARFVKTTLNMTNLSNMGTQNEGTIDIDLRNRDGVRLDPTAQPLGSDVSSVYFGWLAPDDSVELKVDLVEEFSLLPGNYMVKAKYEVKYVPQSVESKKPYRGPLMSNEVTVIVSEDI